MKAIYEYKSAFSILLQYHLIFAIKYSKKVIDDKFVLNQSKFLNTLPKAQECFANH